MATTVLAALSVETAAFAQAPRAEQAPASASAAAPAQGTQGAQTAPNGQSASNAQNAQPAQNAPLSAEAKLHFNRAVKLYAEEDYRGALVEFKRTYDVSGISLVLYNIGQTQFQLRDYAGALQSFEKYLSASGAQMSPARKQQVEKDIEDLHGRVAKLSIETSVEDAEISIDDVLVGKTPLSQVVVSAGIRKIVATHPNLAPVTKTMEVAGGDELRVRLDFATPERAPSRSADRTTDASQADASANGVHPLVFVGYGAAIAGLAVGGTFGALALGSKSDLDANCASRVCPASSRGDVDTMNTQATVSTIGFGVAAVGAIVGTYFLVTGRHGTHPSTGSNSPPRVTPWVSGTAGGLVGSF